MRVGPVIKTSLFSSLPPPRLIVGSATKRLFFSEIRFGKKGSLVGCRGYTYTCAAYAWNAHTPSVLEPMLILSGCSKEGRGKRGSWDEQGAHKTREMALPLKLCKEITGPPRPNAHAVSAHLYIPSLVGVQCTLEERREAP